MSTPSLAPPPPAPPVGRRALAKARHRDALVQAAWALFRRDGFEATTIDAIADAAGVSRRTFFRYFATKDAAVFPHAEARLAAFEALLRPRTRDEAPLEAVRRACREVGLEFQRARDELVLQAQLVDASPALIARERDLDRRWEEALARALAGPRGLAGPAARRARFLAAALMGAFRAALREWFASGGAADLVALGEEALDLVVGAAPRPPAPRPRRSS